MSRDKIFMILKIALAISGIALATWYIINGDFGGEITLREAVLTTYLFLLFSYCSLTTLEED